MVPSSVYASMTEEGKTALESLAPTNKYFNQELSFYSQPDEQNEFSGHHAQWTTESCLQYMLQFPNLTLLILNKQMPNEKVHKQKTEKLILNFH